MVVRTMLLRSDWISVAGEVVVEVPDDAVLMADNCSIRDVLEGELRLDWAWGGVIWY